MKPIDLTGARARLAAATPGPWRWAGYTNGRKPDVRLETVLGCGQVVMGFERWGFFSAQPSFAVYRSEGWPGVAPEPGWGNLHTLHELAEAERKAYPPTLAAVGPTYDVRPEGPERFYYRYDFHGIRHPDASFIEHAWADLSDALAEVDRVEAERAIFEQALVDIVNGRWSDGEHGAVERAHKALSARSLPAAKEGAA